MPWGRTVDMTWVWLWLHNAVLWPLVGAPAPRWQQAAEKESLGPMWPATTTAVIGGQQAPTTQEIPVYQRGLTIQVTAAMQDVMAVMGWIVVLLIYEQPRHNLDSDTRLHQLLLDLLNIRT